MDKLQQLLKERETFAKYNSEVPAHLEQQIAEEQLKMLKAALIPVLESSAPELDIVSGSDTKFLVAYEYVGNEARRVGITTDVESLNTFAFVKEISARDDEIEEPENEHKENPELRRTASIGFSVHFADGKVVAERNAQRTMIEALRYMGLERASRYNATFAEYPLIGKRQRPSDEPNKWQRNVDGWWVYINISNEKKIAHLENIAKMLNIPMKIIRDDSTDTGADGEVKQIRKRTMFSLNGGPAFYKNKSVLNVLRHFISEMPNATYSEICEYFPRELQGGYGVFETLSQIAERKAKGQDAEKRYFLGADEILTSGDGVRFAVSTQWGDNFGKFQEHIAKELGWTLEEVR